MLKKFLIISMILSLFGLGSAFAIQDLMPLSGSVTNSTGSVVNSGDLQVLIYDAATGGNLIYDSGSDFNGTIINGTYNVLLGFAGTNLSLTFGKIYYLDLIVNGENLNFGANARQMFQSNIGEIKRTSSSSSATGLNSFAGGKKSTASGNYSFAYGNGANASGLDSFALGYQSISNETLGFAVGDQNSIASGYSSFAHNGEASGSYSSSFNGIANGTHSFAVEGMASGTDSIALGRFAEFNGTTIIYQHPWSRSSGINSFSIQGGGAKGTTSFARGLINVLGNYSFGISLSNFSEVNLTQSNTFAVTGGNSGFGTTAPQRTVQIKDVMRLEPRATAPTAPALGDIYVNNRTNDFCFYNGVWKGLNGNLCDIYDFNSTQLNNLYKNNFSFQDYTAISINGTIIQFFNINNTGNTIFIKDSSLNNPYELLKTELYFNETSNVKGMLVKINSLFKRTTNNPGYFQFKVINSTEEDIISGNTLYLGQTTSQHLFNLSGIVNNISNIVINNNLNQALLTIDGLTNTQSIGQKILYGSYNWTLNNITKNNGDLGRLFINITRQ